MWPNIVVFADSSALKEPMMKSAKNAYTIDQGEAVRNESSIWTYSVCNLLIEFWILDCLDEQF